MELFSINICGFISTKIRGCTRKGTKITLEGPVPLDAPSGKEITP